MKRILVTGGAGYIGSLLVARLLERGDEVRVVDAFLFGGESLLAFLHHKNLRLIKGDICDPDVMDRAASGVDTVVHLAALVGFPACNQVGPEETCRVNVAGTESIYEAASRNGASRLIFASSYSNYGRSAEGTLLTEDSGLEPQSLYAESKVKAERYLLLQEKNGRPSIVSLRLATVFGLSARTRFDLMVNQFVRDAFLNGKITVYQKDFKRSFIHLHDLVRAFLRTIDAPEDSVRGQIFNVGSEKLNTTKSHLVDLVLRRLPHVQIEHRDLDFAGDMRSMHLSCAKFRKRFDFECEIQLEDGIDELCASLENGIILEPTSERHRNHPPIVV